NHVHLTQLKSASEQCGWAWENYKTIVEKLISTFNVHSVLEIGGGRSPLFEESEVDAMQIELAVNDISEHELSLAPPWAHKTCFDVSAPSIPQAEMGRYDLIVSKMVLEHVRDGKQ